MHGIVGLISEFHEDICRNFLYTILNSIQYEPFYNAEKYEGNHLKLNLSGFYYKILIHLKTLIIS